MVVKLDIGNDTVVLAMSNADNINIEINNVHSTFLNIVNVEGRCTTLFKVDFMLIDVVTSYQPYNNV